MKKILSVILLFIAIETSAQSKDEIAIRRLLDEQAAAWNRGNIEDFMKGYWKNDSLMFIGKSGITYGWNNTLNNYKKSYPDTTAMGKLSFNIITVKQLSSEHFHIVGKWYLKRSIGNLSGYFTLVFKKIDDAWVIVSDHSS